MNLPDTLLEARSKPSSLAPGSKHIKNPVKSLKRNSYYYVVSHFAQDFSFFLFTHNPNPSSLVTVINSDCPNSKWHTNEFKFQLIKVKPAERLFLNKDQEYHHNIPKLLVGGGEGSSVRRVGFIQAKGKFKTPVSFQLLVLWFNS